MHSRSSFWFVVIMIAVFCVVVFPFQEFGPDYFQQATGETLVRSGLLTGMINLVSIGLGPAVGLVIDRYGQRPALAAASWTAAFICLFALATKKDLFADVSMFVIMSGLAVAISILQPLLWPMLALLVPRTNVFSTVYGCVFVLVNIGQVLTYWQIGVLSQEDSSYHGVILLLLSIWCIGWIAAVLLVNADPASSNNILTNPARRCPPTHHHSSADAAYSSVPGAGDDGTSDEQLQRQLVNMSCGGGGFHASAVALQFRSRDDLDEDEYTFVNVEDHGA